MTQLNTLNKTRFERLPVSVYSSQIEGSHAVAKRIGELIRTKQASGNHVVLGLATGSSPIGIYAELVRMHREEGLSFKNVYTFNLDEYYPMEPHSEQSYVAFMKKHLLDLVDIPRENIHIPSGIIPLDQVEQYCKDYEQRILDLGGIDLQLLGIGRSGHIGFNEPGSEQNSLTRMVVLDEITRKDAIGDFDGLENVPTKAITMGIGTILGAREVILIAWNTSKAEIIKKAIEGDVSSDVPATFLQLCENIEAVLDEKSASYLSRFL